MNAGKRFLDTQQVAEYLGVHEKQVYTLIHDRGLPATKITGKWLFPVHLLDRWLESSVMNMPDLLPAITAAPEMLLIAGSDDPLFARTVFLYRDAHPGTLVLQSRAGSTDGLTALKRGLVHMACVHLADPEGAYTTGHIRERLGQEIAVVHFAGRQQGLILPAGNPRSIEDPSQAFRAGLKWAVREVGTGTRALMELEMDRAGVDPGPAVLDGVRVLSHLDAALTVMSGQAEAAFGVEAAAHMAGCAFLPVRQESFDLVVRRQNFFLPRVQEFLALLGEEEFRRTASSLGGYDVSGAGRVVA